MDKKTIMNDEQLAVYLKSISGDMLRVAHGFINDVARVDDVISETIYRVYRYRKKVKNPEFFKSWIIRILINECKAELMKMNETLPLMDDFAGEVHTESYDDLYSMIQNLTSPYREIVMLKTVNDYTFNTIAQVTEINENTVKTYYYRAVDLLREEMKLNDE